MSEARATKPTASVALTGLPGDRRFTRPSWKTFSAARRFGTTWYTLSIDAAASQLRRPREELVNALVEAQERGTIELKPRDVRVRYRRIRQPGQLEHLVDRLMARLLQREAREIARLHEVLHLATHDGCQTNWLASYFGEQRTAPCGHCQWCRTGQPLAMPPSGTRVPDRSIIRAAIDAREMHEELREEPSVLAKFLCGIRSPRTSHAQAHVARAFRRLPDHTVSDCCQCCPPRRRFLVPRRILKHGESRSIAQ